MNRPNYQRAGSCLAVRPATVWPGLCGLVFRNRDPDEALRSRNLVTEGDRQAVIRFLRLFPLSRPALLPVNQ